MQAFPPRLPYTADETGLSRESFSSYVKHLYLPIDFSCSLCERYRPVDALGLCEECRTRLRVCPVTPPYAPLDGAASAFAYEGSVSHCILRWKSNSHSAAARFFVQFMHPPKAWQADVVVPVPLHPADLRKRGFNQSEQLAELLCKAEGLPMCRALLQKTRRTAPQKGLNAEERRVNLQGAFTAAPLCQGLRILLVDDVITTGATACACAAALRKAGAERVFLLTAAAVLPK